MSRVLFTADTHFGHSKIVEHCHRPFATAEEMDDALVANWNATVRPGDTIYHLGDFALCRKSRALELFEALAGEKHLIAGNHDHEDTRKLPWRSVRELRRVRITNPAAGDDAGGYRPDQFRIVLCHYPLVTWQGADDGAWHLHGHCHGNLRDDGQPRIDVGVDARGFAPVTLETIVQLMHDRFYTPVDHHDHVPELAGLLKEMAHA